MMKLIGSVSNVERTIAKHVGDKIEEKRKFLINVRPASTRPSYQYGYGSFGFTIHGQELADIGIDLGDKVEVVVYRDGETYDRKDLEDARHDLYSTQEKLVAVEGKLAQMSGNVRRAEERAASANTKSQALQLENVRLLTELTTLKAMLQPGSLPPMLDASKGEIA